MAGGKRHGKHETTLWVVFVVCIVASPASQQTTTDPVMTGLIISLPWDVANTLRAPLGGPIAILFAAVFALVLFFGLLLAPVNYIFGYPSRIYHPARQPGIITELLYEGRSNDADSHLVKNVGQAITKYGNSSDYENYEGELSRSFSDPILMDEQRPAPSFYSNFVDSAFLLIPEEDVNCRKLIACHAHGFLQLLPSRITKLLRFFSKRTTMVPEEYKAAVRLGLADQGACQRHYQCHKDASLLLREVYLNFLPQGPWNLATILRNFSK